MLPNHPTRVLVKRAKPRGLQLSDMRLVDGYKVYARRKLVAVYGTGTPDLVYQFRRLTGTL